MVPYELRPSPVTTFSSISGKRSQGIYSSPISGILILYGGWHLKDTLYGNVERFEDGLVGPLAGHNDGPGK